MSNCKCQIASTVIDQQIANFAMSCNGACISHTYHTLSIPTHPHIYLTFILINRGEKICALSLISLLTEKNFHHNVYWKKTYAEVDIIRLQVIAVKKYLLMEKKTSFIWNQLTINKSFFMFSCHLLQISNRT